MSKKLSLVFASVILFSAQIVSAQSYFGVPTYQQNAYIPSTSNCVLITRDLTVGSRGSDVRSLQNFLVSRNYPGGGQWLVTGYFGRATRAGVINFQIDSGIAQTGWVDAATRNAISNASCQNSLSQNTFTGSGIFNPYQSYPYNYNYTPAVTTQPVVPPSYSASCNVFPFGQNCPNNGIVSISYLSPSSGAVGTFVTVFGNGFTPTGNTVRFGNGIIANLNSTDGRTVSFTVPSTLTGYGTQAVYLNTYAVSASNSYGATSNSLPFAVTSLGSLGAPSVSNVSGPNTIAVNTTGTWTLSLNNLYNQNYTSVSVNWGDTLYGASAQTAQQVYGGSQTLSFTHAYAQSGTYTITFTATNGQGQSSMVSTTVTVTGYSNSGLTLSYMTPTSGHVGTQIQLVGTGFSTLDNTVHFANGGTLHVPSQNGTTIYFTIPAYFSACDLVGAQCGAPAQLVSTGAYQIYVSNGNGSTNQITFNVI